MFLICKKRNNKHRNKKKERKLFTQTNETNEMFFLFVLLFIGKVELYKHNFRYLPLDHFEYK